MITKAATFVKDPAYGKRTALLALASDADSLSDEEFQEELLALIDTEPKGGNKRMDEKDTKIKDLETALASATTEVQTARTAEATTRAEIEALTSERDTLKTENDALVKENDKFKKDAILSERMRVYAEAGLTLEADAEKAGKRKEFLISLSDEAFTTYIEDLKIANATKKVAIASRGRELPRLEIPKGREDLQTLKNQMRVAARGE